ncbi:MAG: hypothetical protein QOJ26_575, partial [Thermoplasmata archaeon]|nr:hypothetical protein [Thermoplasmata archaeon]
APMGAFLACAHPWLIALLCAGGSLILVLADACPWPSSRAAAISRTGLACCIAVMGTSLGIALQMPSFGQTIGVPAGTHLPTLGLLSAVIGLAPIAVLTLMRRRAWTAGSFKPLHPHVLVRAGLSLAIAIALAVAWTIALQQGMPDQVDLPRMLGWPLLLLSFAALVALPFIASPVANLAASLFAVTVPFVVFNPLHSEFLPHRTIVFLGLAMAGLAGVAAGALVRAIASALRSMTRSRSKAPSTRSTWGSTRRFALAVAPALLVCTLLGGSVYAGTPDSYPGGWYRLYNSCELDALQDIAHQADADPSAIVVTGDWQAKLVLGALTTNASRVWYKADVFTSEEARDDLVAVMDHNGRPVIVVMDRYLTSETAGADTRFVNSPPWEPMGSWCAGMGIAQARITAHTTNGGA